MTSLEWLRAQLEAIETSERASPDAARQLRRDLALELSRREELLDLAFWLLREPPISLADADVLKEIADARTRYQQRKDQFDALVAQRRDSSK